MSDKKLVYIIGSGRSGTTLIDILLGNDLIFFSAGELNRYLRRKGISPGRSESSESFIFWDKFRQELNIPISKKLCSEIESFEYHSGWGRWRLRPALYEQYKAYQKRFFSVLAGFVEKDVIIDSSKYPLRAYHLSKIFPSDFRYCIYLKKHPVSVLRSFQKRDVEQPAKSWWSVCIYLMVVHLLSAWVVGRLRKSGVKVFTTSFESVVNDPRGFVKALSLAFEMNLSDLEGKLARQEPIIPHFLFDGNRIRLEEELVIKPQKPPENWSLKERFVYVCNRFWWKN